MQVTLSEQTAEIVNTLTNDQFDAVAVIETAVNTLAWAKDASDRGLTVLAAKSETVDDDTRWVQDEFFPHEELFSSLGKPAAETAE